MSINNNKINPLQLNNYLMERLYEKGSKGIYNLCYRNAIDKFSQIIEEDFISTDVLNDDFISYENMNVETNIDSDYYKLLKSNISSVDNYKCSFSINQMIDSEKLPEKFAIFLRIGLTCNPENKKISNYKEIGTTYDSPNTSFTDILNCLKFFGSNNYVTFENIYNNSSSYKVKMGDFFKSIFNNSSDTPFFDGIISRKQLLDNGVIEIENQNRLKVTFEFECLKDFGFFISLIQIAYSCPTNYPIPNGEEE